MIDRWLLDCGALGGLEEAIDCEDASRWTGPEWGTRLKCPICSDTYQHAETWQHIPGRDNYEAGWGGRGDLVIIPVWGECEHRWELCFGAHKGETFCFVRVPHDQERAA
jgi:hypothetical protein